MRTMNVLAFSSCALIAQSALAGGFAISEMGSRAAGRGNAVTGRADDASTIFYNPANITELPGLQVDLGATIILPRWSFRSADGETTNSGGPANFPPNLSVAYNAGELGFGNLAFGIGFYVPYGANFTWPADGAFSTEVQEITVLGFELNPVVALRPHKRVSVAVGFRYIPGVVYLKRAVDFGAAEPGEVEMGGRGHGLGANAAVTVRPMPGLSVGFLWRSESTLKMSGDSDFAFPAPFDTQAVDKPVSTDIPLPQVFRVGASYDVLPNCWSVSADLQFQMWERFKALEIKFEEADGSTTVNSEPRDARNSYVLHLGTEYRVSDSVLVRAGYAFDQHILPDRTMNPAPPDSDLHVASVGASYFTGRFGIHAHYSNVFFAKRTTANNPHPGEWTGTHGSTALYIAGLSLSARFLDPAEGELSTDKAGR